MKLISVCFSPALYPHYAGNDAVVVIVDVFRASTSMCTAFENGVKSIRTVAGTDEAKRYKSMGYLVAAERNTQKCDFADFGNSPFDFTPEKVRDKELIFTTTNGTQAVEVALGADEIIIGAFTNISTVADFCSTHDKNVIVLCAGWNNRFCIEDTLFAGALTEKLLSTGKFSSTADSTRVALELWHFANPDIFQYICKSEHYGRLKAHGLENSAEYCLSHDLVSLVPRWNKDKKAFLIST